MSEVNIRMLAAIMFTDMVGYTALMQQDEALAKAFAKPVVLLLGEADTERSKVLRKTPLSDAQGQNRLERGKKFFAEAKAKAEAMGVPFKWQLVTVSGVGHNDAQMAEAAAKLLAQLKK